MFDSLKTNKSFFNLLIQKVVIRFFCYNMLGKIRTLSPQIRSLVLYPIELQAQAIVIVDLSEKKK